MRSEKLKSGAATAVTPFTLLSHFGWRVVYAARNKARNKNGDRTPLWLNIGSGVRPFEGFVNIDVNVLQRPDMWLDVRHGLPFPDQSVDRIYTCHALEHFYPDDLVGLLREIRRVLVPDGGIRLLVPDMGILIERYLARRADLLPDFPRPYRSLGGRLQNQLFCDGQHKTGWDFTFADEILREQGFRDVALCKSGQGALFDKETLLRLEPPDDAFFSDSLIVEARP